MSLRRSFFAIPALFFCAMLFMLPIDLSAPMVGAASTFVLLAIATYAGHRLFRRRDPSYAIVLVLASVGLIAWIIPAPVDIRFVLIVLALLALIAFSLVYRHRLMRGGRAANPAAG